MGIVNVTPDSFSDGGTNFDADRAVESGLAMIADGATVVDVGGESTRPGAEPVTAREEIERVVPVIDGLVAGGATVSIDTTKPDVASAALEAGAVIVNDVTGLGQGAMIDVVAQSNAGCVVMHMQGTPRTMQAGPT